MNVFSVTLFAIAAMLLVVLFIALPLIFGVKGLSAWRDIPREVYNQRPQRLFRLRPIYFWIAAAVLGQIGDFFEWLKWPIAQDIAKTASLVIFLVVLVSHLENMRADSLRCLGTACLPSCFLVWAIRVRSDANADGRVRHFAQYAFWGSAICLSIAAAACVNGLTRMLHSVLN